MIENELVPNAGQDYQNAGQDYQGVQTGPVITGLGDRPRPLVTHLGDTPLVNYDSQGLAREKAEWPGLSAERTAREEREQFKRRVEEHETRLVALENALRTELVPGAAVSRQPEPSANTLLYTGPNRRVKQVAFVGHQERREFPGYSGK